MKVGCDFGSSDYKSLSLCYWPYLLMSRFLLGDQLGNIKVLRYSPQKNSIDIKTVHHQEFTPASSVEHLAINSSNQTKVRANLHYFWKLNLIISES